MKMPFGKHKNEEIAIIPKPYLYWLHKQKWLGGWLKKAVAERLGLPITEKPKEPWQPSEGEPWEG